MGGRASVVSGIKRQEMALPNPCTHPLIHPPLKKSRRLQNLPLHSLRWNREGGVISLTKTLAKPSKQWQRFLNTPLHRASLSTPSTHIHFGVAAQTLSPSRVTWIPKSKKWVGGEEQPSKSTYGRSWCVSPKECSQVWKRNSILLILPAMHSTLSLTTYLTENMRSAFLRLPPLKHDHRDWVKWRSILDLLKISYLPLVIHLFNTATTHGLMSLIVLCHFLQSTHEGAEGFMQYLSTVHQLFGPTSIWSGIHIYMFNDGGEVCGRYADDVRLIRASVTEPTSVMDSHSKLLSSVIILINGQLFSLGCRVLHFNIKPCSFGTTQTCTPFSHLSSSCSPVANSNKHRSSRKTWHKY